MSNSRVKLIVENTDWKYGPNLGFLTPTGFFEPTLDTQRVYGGVRDDSGRSVIRGFSFESDSGVKCLDEICFDRRGSNSFDTDGTILGHISQIKGVVRLYYVGFKKSKRVKFEAFSGLAESLDKGFTFQFKRKIFDKVKFPFLEGKEPSIVACHWNNLDFHGDGLALVSIGTDWVQIGDTSYPKYSSHLIRVEEFQFAGLVCSLPQKSEIYRLGRPRFLIGHEFHIAVATGGKLDGDYRPYFFEFDGSSFTARPDIKFPIEPGFGPGYSEQVSYPEVIKFKNVLKSIVLFNGDKMGQAGCFGFSSQLEFIW